MRALSDLLVVVAALALVLAGIEVASGRWAGRAVLSGSMRPSLGTGSVALVQRIPIGTARVGDVLVLHRPGGSHELFVHRVISLDPADDGIAVRTKGDNNTVADPGQLLVRGPYAYVVRYDIPYLGYVSSWRYSEIGQHVLLVLGGLVLLLAVALLLLPSRDQRLARRGRHMRPA